MLDGIMVDEREPNRNKRIHVIARHLVSKRYSRKLRSKYKTLQMIIENENFIHEKATTLESMLRREASIYDYLRCKKGRTCSLRRRTLYYRLFYSYGLTIPVVSWLLDVSASNIKSNIGAAFREHSSS